MQQYADIYLLHTVASGWIFIKIEMVHTYVSKEKTAINTLKSPSMFKPPNQFLLVRFSYQNISFAYV